MASITVGMCVSRIDDVLINDFLRAIFGCNFSFLSGYVNDDYNEVSHDVFEFPSFAPSSCNRFTFRSVGKDNFEVMMSLVDLGNDVGVELWVDYDDVLKVISEDVLFSVFKARLGDIFAYDEVMYVFADPDENVELSHNMLLDNIDSFEKFYPLLYVRCDDSIFLYESGLNLLGI